MRQIIPFKKELLMNTKINEVTSISLEHKLSIKEDGVIVGQFIVSGEYKMTEASINREKFNFDIPVSISLDEDYDYDTTVIDIDNFYYEVVNDEILKVNIDLYVDATKKEKLIIDAKVDEDTNIIDNDEENVHEQNVEVDEEENVIEKKDEEINSRLSDDDIEESVSYKKIEKNNFDLVDDNLEKDEKKEINFLNTSNFSTETYATYYVYIVKEDDTIEKILDKFGASKEDLSDYNDINDIKRGMKLIIPVKNE